MDKALKLSPSSWRFLPQRYPRLCIALLWLMLAALLVVLWWWGPGWAVGDHHPLQTVAARAVATALVGLGVSLVWGLRMRRRFAILEAERRQRVAGDVDPCLEHLARQEQRLDAQLAQLRSHLGRRGYLYALPWYLVLGEEGAGKTSFVNRSGQNFALTRATRAGASASEASQAGVLHSIDWWVSPDAVLIDPAGELISQYVNETRENPQDKSGQEGRTRQRLWLHLLGWLDRRRSRRPLNGVVLAMDVAALLTGTPSERANRAARLRARLMELTQHLGTRLPVYVVLTKLDLLEGFDACFAHLPRAVRDEVLGFTFTPNDAVSSEAWLEALGVQFDALVATVNESALDRFAELSDVAERRKLFAFIRQLAGMRPILLDALQQTLESDCVQPPGLVRGVYFSSVFQQGVVTDAFATTAGQSFGIEEPLSYAHASGRATAYFAPHFFEKIVYPEAGLAGDNVRLIASKRRWFAWNAIAATTFGLIVLGLWQYHYGINRDKALSVLAKSQAFTGHAIDTEIDPTGRNLLQPLNQIRDAVSVFGDYRETWPLLSNLGLYQGRAIGPRVDAAYLGLLSQRFLPALASGVVETMTAAPPDSEPRMAALRVYRMIEDRENRQPALVEAWMAKQWQAAFPGDGAIQDALQEHLDYALRYASANLPMYHDQVADVQQQLKQRPLVQRLYSSMKAQARDTSVTSLDLRHEVGPIFDLVYRVPAGAASATLVDGFFTAQGLREDFQPHANVVASQAMLDQWALGERSSLHYSDADKQAMTERLRTLYSADYIDRWHAALASIEVTDIDDMAQAIKVLEAMTGPAAPLRRLLETVRDQTDVGAVHPDKTAKAGDSVEDAPDARIRRAFLPLTRLLEGRGEKASYLDETLQSLGNLYDYLKAIDSNPDRGGAALKATLDRFAGQGPDPIRNVQLIANGLPEPVQTQVRTLADQSEKALITEALVELDRRWQADVYRFYAERLADRYPFNPASATDASLQDFETFFGPKGRLAQFNDQALQAFREHREVLSSAGQPVSLLAADVLNQFDTAQRITQVFFDNRGALSVPFTVEPLGLTPNRRGSVLNVDGQLIPFNHGPSHPVGLLWPNTLSDAAQSQVTLITPSGLSNALTFRGPWSLFRLLSRAHLMGSTSGSVDLGFAVNDGVMRYRVVPGKGDNPFTQRVFQGFMLPRSLLPDSDGLR
jgi:type VI secretion system protein ImpL